MAESFDEVCANIKACLNSSKRQVSLSDLNRDYHSVLGTSIPFRSLGYHSLEQFIRVVPNLKISNVGSEIYVDVKLDAKTMHITNLVRGQKSTAKKKPVRNFSGKTDYYKPPPPLRRSPTPSKSQYRGGSRFNAPNYYEEPQYIPPKRNLTVQNNKEDFNNHGDQPRVDSSFNRKYKSSSVSHNNFSDEQVKYIDLTSDCRDSPVLEYNRSINLHVISGNSRKVTVSRPINRSMGNDRSKNNSVDEDYGYSSMNEIPPLINDFPKSSETDFITSNTRKMSLKHGPAAVVAAGRAMIEPKTTPKEEMMDTYPIPMTPVLNFIDSMTCNRQFQSLNRQPVNSHLTELLVDVNSFSKNSLPSMMNSPSSPAHGGKSSPMTVSTNSSTPTKPTNSSTPTMPINSSTPTKPMKQFSSKMSDPNMFNSGPDIVPDFSEGTYCYRLLMFTKQHNLPIPEFKNFHKPDLRTGTKYFLSRVKIGKALSFGSFPLESTNLKDVQEKVAKDALEDLRRRHESVDSACLSITKNEKLVIDRIAEIVNPHSTGLKSSFVESQYKVLYREILPLNWIDIIKQMSLLSVEELVGGTVVYPAVTEGSSSSSSVTSLPELILPLSNSWDVFITFVSSSTKIYFRIIHEEYNGLYETMADNMGQHYSSDSHKRQPVDNVKEGSFYAICVESDWFRVKTMQSAVDDKVMVLLIDIGKVAEISTDIIYTLDKPFTDLPAQAVRCGLTNLEILEEYNNEPYIVDVIDSLIGEKCLVALVNSRNPRLQLTLHDTSTDEDVNVNEIILNKIKEELTPPKIPSKNSVARVHLTSVLEDGQAYVQLVSDSLTCLQKHLHEANEILRENEELYVVRDATELVGSTICLVKYLEDSKWHRASVLKLVPDTNEAQVVYIDYGNLEVVPFNRIVDSQRISSILSALPAQAILVELTKPTQDIFTEKIIDFLMKLALPKTPDGAPETFIMKIVENGNHPFVELFIRLTDDNELHSVNNIIGTCFKEYRGKDFQMITISKELSENFRPIQPFNLPLETDEFHVYVYMVSNPHEFFVQPHDYRRTLKDVMTTMNQFYCNERPSVNIEDLTIGQVYAVKCEDDMWYRGICINIFESMNSISIKLVDFGNIISVKYKDLSHLLPCFRELPSLAIKAELAGIAPKNYDWDIGDCLRFKDLVCSKVLISFIVDDSTDKVSMLLFDTSVGGQIDIGAQLVSEGIATDITEKI